MKKICSIFFLTAMLSSAIFAKEISFNLSVPFQFENVSQSGITSKTFMTSAAFGIDGLEFFSDRIGMYSEIDIFFPQIISLKLSSDTETASYIFTSKDYNLIAGFSAMFGPAFVVYKNEKFLFTVSPGIHGGFLFSDGNSLSLTYMFGLGGNFRAQISFSDSGYFNFGTTVIYDLYGMNIDGNSGKMNTWTVSPKLGVGFIFWF